VAAPTVPASGSATNTNGNASGTSAAGTIPTGAASGDVLFASVGAAVSSASASSVTSVPANWNQLVLFTLSNPVSIHGLYWARYSDVSGTTPTWGVSPSAGRSVGIVAVRGADTTTPVAAGEVASTSLTSSTASPQNAPSIATAGPDRLIVRIYQRAANTVNTWSTPTGYTERFDFGSTAAYGPYVAWDDVAQTSQGSQGTAASAPSFTGTPNQITLISFAVQAPALTSTQTDNIGITDSTVPQKGYLVTNPEGITDSLAKARGIVKADAQGLSDSVVYVHTRPAEWITGYYSI
jgi:hypothetical protein